MDEAQMATFNEDVSVLGTLTIERALTLTGIEVESLDNISNAGVHINTINTGGTTPYVVARADGPGMLGESVSSTGVTGKSQSGFGVLAQSDSGSGLVSTSGKGQAISAFSDNDIGIFVQAGTYAGVFNGALVVNANTGPKDSKTPNPAADINGSIVITEGSLFVNKGDVNLGGADCAEDFDIVGENVDPGTVMVIHEEGVLGISDQPYDKRVAGVVSGAGDFKPGIVLDRNGAQGERKPIALIGKVYCKVDAQHGPIEVGDLLTTSPTPGHAMKAADPFRAFGAVIGKALRPLDAGEGMIPILISLQ
jgi:hypothetical protein